MEHSKELRDLILGFYHDVAQGDTSARDRVQSTSALATGIGTDRDEWRTGGAAILVIIHKHEEELGGPIKWTAGRREAFVEGSVGWVRDDHVLALPDGTTPYLRVTYVLHREVDGWKIVHTHASEPVDTPTYWGRPLTTSIEAVADLIGGERPDLTPLTSSEGTVTIMFTDIENSTATNEALGDDHFLPLLLRHHDIVNAQTGAASGAVVKPQGDGFMLAFSSVRRGVECAIGIRREVSALDGPIYVRMGLHTGEPVRHADDFFGRDVAYAARIRAAASGGEILVSALVRSLVEPSGSVSFDGPRELELKGFDGPQAVYSVEWKA
jgi:class 3 adenylate cyclase